MVVCGGKSPGNRRERNGVRVEAVGSFANPFDLRRVRRLIGEMPRPRITLVQYVPQMYGLKGMNLGFAWWLNRLSGEPVWVNFHEVAVGADAGASWRLKLLSMATRVMVRWISGRADELFAVTPSWGDAVKRLCGGTCDVTCLPVPSSLPLEPEAGALHGIRRRLLAQGWKRAIGHFGTYPNVVRGALKETLLHVLQHTDEETGIVLIGRGSRMFLEELQAEVGDRLTRIIATGGKSGEEAAAWICGCDVMLQPYDDGASGRRSSLMACLALGRAVVTCSGWNTERMWGDAGAVRFEPFSDPGRMAGGVIALLNDDLSRHALEERARGFYAAEFSLERTIQVLREKACGVVS